MLPHSKLDLCASPPLSISVLQDTKPPAARENTDSGERWWLQLKSQICREEVCVCLGLGQLGFLCDFNMKTPRPNVCGQMNLNACALICCHFLL